MTNYEWIWNDKPREECGIIAICAPGADVARLTFYGLYALQHRGQESAGIATSDGRVARIHKEMGLAPQVFDEQSLAALPGHLAIGHTRYSTTGGSHIRNAQPFLVETMHGPLGVAHNGNLTNAPDLRRELLERGVGLTSTSDSEVITQLLAGSILIRAGERVNWEERLVTFMDRAEGAYSLAVLTRDAVYIMRDPWGFRPLCLGELALSDGGVGWVAASESCALETIGAQFAREVAPGEIVRLDPSGIASIPGQALYPRALCVFEFVYFARADSQIDGQIVHQVRQRLGCELARESPMPGADIVVAVPESSAAAALGYSTESGVPFNEGFARNRYVGRTFIQPDDRLRKIGVAIKFNPLPSSLRGKRVVMIDDSIVRGTTVGPLVQLLRRGGAAEVHVRVASPPVCYPCFMGIDMASFDQLIGAHRTVEEIREQIGADSLAYLSHEGMMKAVRAGLEQELSYCSACFSGQYPVPVPEHQVTNGCDQKMAFESIWGE